MTASKTLEERPDYIRCISHNFTVLATTSWCGRELTGIDAWVFTSIDHAAVNGEKEGRLVACPECTGAVLKALQNGQ